MFTPEAPAFRMVLPICKMPPFQIPPTKPVLSLKVQLVMRVRTPPSVSIPPPPRVDELALTVQLTKVMLALPLL